ncbi:hypothetical protein [Burkholderia lata]|uniref:hypothetical protein n=1 Tax=Burkholderia lata (strain ATCC 17760 / DSM 23089 / LMG 22485 / NCIMB 9086 / R18194 / 383) TaxID=482957 RepID=UPI0012FD754A|nr:hypothetical protein [Burkholderia lata]
MEPFFGNAFGTPDSPTPRLGKGADRKGGKESGVSAATSVAGLDSGKYVALDLEKRCSCGLQATNDKSNDHVTIRPINDSADSKLIDLEKPGEFPAAILKFDHPKKRKTAIDAFLVLKSGWSIDGGLDS